ncbi:uncharacterized protein LOC121878774 [Homarus americanus]|uniref:uncharacterized protein LOC121878774 n=1 Tax=Homarus americanus TaxID=6706 RepID=UPI001C440DE1|nr:uncharacterized protein LOC121878774 [Homarus americanus]
MKTGGQTLTGVNVMRNMEASQVTFTGNLIQGANLEHLIRSTAKIDEATTLQQVSFEKLISKKEVMLSGTIQGWNLNEEAMTSNRIMQKVTGKKMFTSNVHFAGPFPVAQYVVVRNYPEDDPFPIDVGDLCNRVGTPGTKLNLKRWTIGGDVDFGKNVTITGTLNGEDVATLEDVFWLSDVPNEIAAVASFDSMNHGANVSLVLDVTGKINGHNLNTVWDQVLKKECREQIVHGEFTIDTLITDFLVTDTVTNPNDDAGVMDLLNILLKDGDQEIKGRLNIVKVDSKGNILLDGTLNGLKIGTDFVQYGKTATITSRKTFMHNLIIQGDLVVVDEGTIQGVDVSELGRLAVRINDASVHTIPGVTTFRGLVYTGLDFQVYGTVDGITINRDTILLKSDNQEMHGILVINPGVPGVVLETRTLIVLDNKFNDLDLDRLSNYTVRIDRPNVIYGEVTFEDVCYFQSLTLENNLINGHNINDLGQFINGTYLSIMEDYLVISLEVAQDTRLILADKGAEIWYYEESSLESMYKILAVMLKSNYLEEKAYDTLVGLDRTLNLVHTYSITPGFPKLYPAVSVAEPVAVAGLGSGLLATCGGQQMSASPSGVQQTADYTLIPTETGIQNNYGHIHSLAGEVGLETAFGINQCRDLVSFRLNDNRLCLAVLDYKASSTVMCGFASTGFRLMNYLGTQRAVKGAWVNLGYITCLFVAEEESDSEPGYLKLFKHNDYIDEMQLVRTLEVPGASDVDVLVKESLAVVVVTSRPNRLCNSSIMVLGITVDNLEIEVYQKLEVFEAVHSSLSLLPMGEVALFIQTRRNLFVYYLKGAKFVFIREIKTTPSMCPSSFPFLYGEPKTLMIPYAGLGWLYSEYHEDTLKLVPSTMYKAVYRGTYGEPLYRGMKI